MQHFKKKKFNYTHFTPPIIIIIKNAHLIFLELTQYVTYDILLFLYVTYSLFCFVHSIAGYYVFPLG